MTKLIPGKPLVRETAAFEHTDQIIVELHPKHLTMRLKHQRADSIDLDYATILNYARRLKSAYAKAPR